MVFSKKTCLRNTVDVTIFFSCKEVKNEKAYRYAGAGSVKI